jgi:hypothetical protein
MMCPAELASEVSLTLTMQVILAEMVESLVQRAGVEPGRPFGQRILSPGVTLRFAGFHFTYIAARLLSMSLILSFTFFVRW